MGPMSAPAGRRITPDKAHGHSKCQDREKCTGPGCRVRPGKTHHTRTGLPTKRTSDRLARINARMATNGTAA